MPTTTLSGQEFSRPRLESLLKRRFFFTESFEIYRTAPNYKGDNRGLYDYGPPGCALLSNIVNEWRRHFVIEENMLELDCTSITPEAVLKTSGHVDKFADWMCRDPVKGDFLRADHLVETVLETRIANNKLTPADTSSKSKAEQFDEATIQQYKGILAKIDNYDGPELGKLIEDLDIRNPNGNGKVEAPTAFNLMFKSTIGPSSAAPVFFRPETAQGQFLNFRKLLDYCQGSMPFASACIGKSYRNEISPRSGLLRVREFLMAEVEHFVDPESNKAHERFSEIEHIELPFLDRQTQLSGKTTVETASIGSAVRGKLVDNETLGYFLARIYMFLIKIGADSQKIRFRQHLDNEMAHYACDCWDAELLTSYGWIECVGCADRSAYDLTVHSKATGTPLTVKENLPEPLEITEWQASLEKKLLGPRFKKDAKKVEAAVQALDQNTLENLAAELAEKASISIPTGEALADGKTTAELSGDMCSIKKITRVEHIREYTPNVIEPSFGIGRILYSILEHVYWYRPQDTAREVLSLPILTAPTKVLLVPLSNHDSFKPTIKSLASRLRSIGIANNTDTSSVSIGRRYARNDELGTPLGITVDFDTVKDGSITLRERDSTAQVRASEDDIIEAVKNLVSGSETWEQVSQRLPAFTGQA
ncbi:glycyl-tRNA synthetase [Cordyceps militaris]|uniref:glycine--tRNA ligase n=1 Tax=Cordyceps militaris TaxID=73501 RepID=A0A2H4STM3_CORMI|nr:glycyl-tRNA synthetase [Cordyceps militaris]